MKMERINMDKGTKFTLNAEMNGSLSISHEGTQITIHPDGTVAISSAAPIQFTGATLAKLDNVPSVNGDILSPYVVQRVVDALARRLEPKKI
jgi:hypothetical protein